VLVNIYYMKSR